MIRQLLVVALLCTAGSSAFCNVGKGDKAYKQIEDYAKKKHPGNDHLQEVEMTRQIKAHNHLAYELKQMHKIADLSLETNEFQSFEMAMAIEALIGDICNRNNGNYERALDEFKSVMVDIRRQDATKQMMSHLKDRADREEAHGKSKR